ncbi:hypothetical protein V8C34DRAFT_306941 [Trichoderma compactum]
MSWAARPQSWSIEAIYLPIHRVQQATCILDTTESWLNILDDLTIVFEELKGRYSWAFNAVVNKSLIAGVYEDDGFGMCHERNRILKSTRPAQEYKMAVGFPVGSGYFVRDVEQGLLATLPESTKTMSRLDVYLREGTRVVVKGYGKPFANPDHPSHGEAPAFSFDNDNEHLAAMTQSQVQDVIWIHKGAQDIAGIRFRAYFISANEGARSGEFYVIVLLDDDFMRRFKDTWQTLVKDEFLQLKMFDGDNDETPASWDVMIMDHPRGLTAMAGHQTDKDDFVLRVRRPQQSQPQRRPDFNVCVFRDRRTANDWFQWDEDNWNSVSLEFNPHLKECKRNVDAVCMFHPQAQPSNLLRSLPRQSLKTSGLGWLFTERCYAASVFTTFVCVGLTMDRMMSAIWPATLSMPFWARVGLRGPFLSDIVSDENGDSFTLLRPDYLRIFLS